MKKTNKQNILEYLETKKCWVTGSELENQANKWEAKASTISRECRTLAENGIIVRGDTDRNTVKYHFKTLEGWRSKKTTEHTTATQNKAQTAQLSLMDKPRTFN